MKLRQKQTLAIYIGAPGSGKSTHARQLAKETGALIVCPDQLRQIYDLYNNQIFDIAREIIVFTLKNGLRPVIFDATNINGVHRKSIIECGKPYSAKVIGIRMDTPLDVCLERHKARQEKGEKLALGEEYIRNVYQVLLLNPPHLGEGFDHITCVTPK